MTPDRLLRARATVCLALSLALLLLGATAVPAGVAASAAPCSPASSGPSRVGHFGGISRPVGVRASSSGACRTATPTGDEAPYYKYAVPPLLDHSGPVMGTSSVGSTVVLTPIFWAPAGYSFTSSYKSLITTYLADLAHDSGAGTNVFATVPQYVSGHGTPANAFTVGAEIDDATAYPPSGCTVNGGGVYADNTGYAICLSDSQLRAEIDAAAGSATRDLGHMYLMFTPKGVESCFYGGNPSNQACTINSSPSAAFCAYHSYLNTASGTTVYATMPFPIYGSPTGYSCTSEQLDGTTSIQQPNGDPDADVEISPLSHEMAEAMTDPQLNAWYDAAGNENGDDCAYIYGSLSGAAGVHYNQTVNGHHYLTQEEFSNADFVPNVSGCLQQTVTPAPSVSAVAPVAGPLAGGTTVTITGTGLLGATAVTFGTAAAPSFTVNSSTSITVTSTPAHAAATVDVTVTTPGGTSAPATGDTYSYVAAPAVTGVSPHVGPSAGQQSVTLTGTGFTGASAVDFGTTAATGPTVVSDTQITVSSPSGNAGAVDVTVTSPGGVSATSAADRYTYVNAPTVTAVAPSAGSTAGGTAVTITGTGFTGASGVTFGTAAASGFAVVSATTITATAPPGSGTADVTVTTVGGTSSTSSADRYTYVAPPTVTAVSPAAGPVAGGQIVTITGTGFTGAVAVGFGASAAATFRVTSDTSITVTVPAHAAGAVNVYVTNAGGHNPAVAADRFTYYAVPTVTGVSPNSGPVAGGQRLTVTGTGFIGATSVSFGSGPAQFRVVSPTRIALTTPAHAAGTVNVYVSTPGGHNAAVAADRYTYRPVPTITHVSPNRGTRSGRQGVTITGTGFTGTTTVAFGSTAARFHVVSSTRITVTTPAHAAATLNVYVTTSGGHNAAVTADRYRFV